ncbi:MAG: hypothetical protein KY434_10075 [Actinobacteria bacterium]|nr:hypothetical protein [Actinomycetota bacterium]
MIAGVAILPSAPLLLEGVAPSSPTGVGEVREAVETIVASLPRADVTVLLAASSPGSSGSESSARGVYGAVEATLAGVGRPDLRRRVEVSVPAMEAITRVTQYPLLRRGTLPLSLSVLALLLGSHHCFAPVAVPATADFAALVGVGAATAQAVEEAGLSGTVVATGDCSAEPGPGAPPASVDGAREWGEAAAAAVADGRLDRLEGLGPERAQRVGAVGWAPMAVLHGVCERSRTNVGLRLYAAPRGAGYLVGGRR